MTESQQGGPEVKAAPWEVLSSEVVIDSKWFPIRKEVVRLPDGTILDDMYMWASPDISTVVPITDEGNFVICRQYRHGMGKVTWQFPAGAVSPGESPQAAGLRETEEEAGYILSEGGIITPLGKVALYTTKMSGMHHMFMVQGVHLGGTKAIDPSEISEVYEKTPKEMVAIVENNELEVADSAVAVLRAFRLLGI